jgi:hypothetical protein
MAKLYHFTAPASRGQPFLRRSDAPLPPQSANRVRRPRSDRFSPAESALALDADAAVTKRAPVLLRYLDVVLVAIAMAPALTLGAPVLGYAVGAGGWVLQRAIAETDQRWIRRMAEPRKQLGVSLFEAFGRTWLLAGVIIIAAVVGGREDGLTAALVIFGAYSVAFAIRVITGPPRRGAVQ